MAHGIAKRSVPQTPSQLAGPAGDPGTDDFVLPNQGFVTKIAAEYRNLGLPFEDLLNEGNVGLLEAAQRFDRQRGTRFITYAMYWIRKSILRAISRHHHLVRVPDYRIRQSNAIMATGRSLSRSLGREAEAEEISRAMSITVEKMGEILQARMKPLPLDARIGESQDESIADRLPDEKAISPETGMIRVETEALLRNAMRRLTAQQRLVIVRRFGLSGGREHTLAELGERLGLSRERVRQIETAATKKLRKSIVNGGSRRARARHADPRHIAAQTGAVGG